MDDYINIRRLVEILSKFFDHKVPVKEDLTCSLTSEFLRNMQDVVFTKILIAYNRWQAFYDSALDIMVLSPEMYLKFVIYPCLQDANVYHNIFEKFLNALALITRINIEISQTKGLDFSYLTVEIFMVLYEKEYRKRFLQRGGFCRLVEYVNNPNYLDTNCIVRNISETYDFYTSNPKNLRDVIHKKYATTRIEPKIPPQNISFQEIETNRHTASLVKKVLNALEHEHDPLCSKEEAPKKDSTQQTPKKLEKESNRIVETAEKESLDSETTREISDITQYENIIDAVIRHNHAKSSGQVKSASRIQKEADRTLEHLKITIKSLIEVLDE